MICFKIKLQLIFRINTNDFYNCKFPYMLMLRIHLQYRKNKFYHEKRTAVWCIVTSLLLKPLKQHLFDVALFRLSKHFILNFGCVFPNFLDRIMCRTKFPTHISFVSSKFYFLYQCNFFFDVLNISFVYDHHCYHFNSLLLTDGVQPERIEGLSL
jgi:hypothetical protein